MIKKSRNKTHRKLACVAKNTEEASEDLNQHLSRNLRTPGLWPFWCVVHTALSKVP